MEEPIEADEINNIIYKEPDTTRGQRSGHLLTLVTMMKTEATDTAQTAFINKYSALI